MTHQIKPHHIGQRLLLTDGYTHMDRKEVVVLELSPSGDDVKVRYASGSTGWIDNDEWSAVIHAVLLKEATP